MGSWIHSPCSLLSTDPSLPLWHSISITGRINENHVTNKRMILAVRIVIKEPLQISSNLMPLFGVIFAPMKVNGSFSCGNHLHLAQTIGELYKGFVDQKLCRIGRSIASLLKHLPRFPRDNYFIQPCPITNIYWMKWFSNPWMAFRVKYCLKCQLAPGNITST